MKRLRILFAASLAAISLWTVSHTNVHAAGAGAVTFTQTDHHVVQFNPNDTNPCTGDPVASTLITNDVFHVTTLANGTDWGTFTTTGSFSLVPVDTSLPSYSGHFTVWGNFNDNLQNGNSTFTMNVHGTGSDGSTLSLHQVMHFSVSATGVVVNFDKFTCG